MKTISITRARADFYDLVDQVSKGKKRIGITNKGETKAVLIDVDDLEALEMLAANPNLLKELKEAEEEIARGEYVTLEDLEKELERDRPKKSPIHV